MNQYVSPRASRRKYPHIDASKELNRFYIFILQLALEEIQKRKDVEAELAKLKKRHAQLEQAWEAGKEKSAKLKKHLIDNRRMS